MATMFTKGELETIVITTQEGIRARMMTLDMGPEKNGLSPIESASMLKDIVVLLAVLKKAVEMLAEMDQDKMSGQAKNEHEADHEILFLRRR